MRRTGHREADEFPRRAALHPYGLQTRTGAHPGHRRGPGEEVLPRQHGLRADRRHRDRRRAAVRPGRPAGLGVRDRVRHRYHRGRARRGAGPAPGRVRHRRGARRTGRARRGDRPGAAHGVRAVGGRTAPEARELPVVRRLRRPGRQHLAAPRGRPEQGLRMDHSSFAALAERHRRELHVHCYRMLASFDEAEDAVQETFLKAWRGRSGFDGGPQFRAWLYRIATNVCLDMLRRSSRRTARGSLAEVPWLQPYPDLLLDQAAPSDEQPEAVAISRETISLAFLAALQVLPPRQRAALIARDVLGWPASETASALGTSVAAANSALQRARATMQSHLPGQRAEWSAGEPSAAERELLGQFIAAHEQPDAVAMGQWRLIPVRANRMPAAASYLRRP